MRNLISLAALAAVLVGCSGGDAAPKEGDNPGAGNAISSRDMPNGSRRQPMSGPGRASNTRPTGPAPSMKGQ